MGARLKQWLASAFAEQHRRRMIIAVAIAIAIHEVFASLVPVRTPLVINEPVERITIAKLTRIEHRPTPKPKPTPRPSPTPQPVVRTRVIAETHTPTPIVNPGSPSQKQRIRRIASARPLVRTRYHSRPALVHVPMGGHGTGTSRVAKADTGGIGPGGTGTGVSGTGSGTGGAPAATEPCGYVEFIPTVEATVDRNTGQVWEHIMMTVHFPDRTSQSVVLDYPWYYTSEASDPWAHNDNAAVPFQFPPPDARSSEPTLVQYVMRHTDSEGYTKLKACPS